MPPSPTRSIVLAGISFAVAIASAVSAMYEHDPAVTLRGPDAPAGASAAQAPALAVPGQ